MNSSFFEQVYRLVRRIPPGQVASYGQVARLLGKTRGARTVGWALSSLPEDRGVPWQRVINSRGTVSLDARGPGGALQRALLEAEGIVFDERGRIDLEVYGWAGLAPAEVQELLEDACYAADIAP